MTIPERSWWQDEMYDPTDDLDEQERRALMQATDRREAELTLKVIKMIPSFRERLNILWQRFGSTAVNQLEWQDQVYREIALGTAVLFRQRMLALIQDALKASGESNWVDGVGVVERIPQSLRTLHAGQAADEALAHFIAHLEQNTSETR